MRKEIVLLMFSNLLASGFYVQPDVVIFSSILDSKTVCEGCRVELSCSIPRQFTSANLPQPEIHWQFNETDITGVLEESFTFSDPLSVSNETHLTSRLIIESAVLAHSGVYRCLASDGMDLVTCSSNTVRHSCIPTNTLSNHAWIQVISNVTSSNVVELPAYSSMVLECGSRLFLSDRDDPMRRIVWDKNGMEMDTNVNNVILSNGDLMVYSLESSNDIHYYDCSVLLGDATVHYQSYQLLSSQFNGNTTILSASSSSHHNTYHVGSTVNLICSVLNMDNSQPLNISWIKYSSSNSSFELFGASYGPHGHILILDEAQLEDSGLYCCHSGNILEEECIPIIVQELESYYHMPSQQFINFRSGNIHNVNLICPLQQPSQSPSLWFWNGNRLTNSTEHVLILSSSDAMTLYGVYQCCIGCLNYPQEGVGDGNLVTVARVMPQGVSNPPGGIRLRELPLPSAFVRTAISAEWVAPRYTGNTSLLGYKVHIITENRTFFPHDSSLHTLVFPFGAITMDVNVHDSLAGDISDDARIIDRSNSTCLYEVLFPPIPSLSCDRGRAHLSWEFNQVENMNYSFTRIYQNEKAYYPEGGCLSEERQPIYKIPYLMEQSNPFVFNNGMVFKAGTRCLASVANTAAESRQEESKVLCYDPRNIQYSDYVSCLVRASVGFTTVVHSVNESVGDVVVCVEAEGYGFTVDVRVNPITASVDDYASLELVTLNFSSSSSPLLCFNLTITDDSSVESTETLQLVLTSTNSTHVVIQSENITVTIMDNDSVRVGFENTSLSVMESAETLDVCIELEGTLERNVSVLITASGEEGNITEVTFTPSGSYPLCFDVPISDNNVLEENKNMMLSLSSSDEGVTLTSSIALIEVQEDDNISVQFSLGAYSVDEDEGMLDVCINVTGILGRYMLLNVVAINDTAIAGRDFICVVEDIIFQPYPDDPIQCFSITILDDLNTYSTDRRFRLAINSNITGVIIPSEGNVVIHGEGTPSPLIAMAIAVGMLMALIVVVTFLIVVLIVSSIIISRRRREKRVAESHAAVDSLWRSENNDYTITPCNYDPISLITFSTNNNLFHMSDDCIDSKSVILSLKDSHVSESRTSSVFFDEIPSNTSILLTSDAAPNPMPHLSQTQLLDSSVLRHNEKYVGYIDMQSGNKELQSRSSTSVLNSKNFIPLMSPPLQDLEERMKWVPADLNQRLCNLSSECDVLHASNPSFEPNVQSSGKNDDDCLEKVSPSLVHLDQDSGLPNDDSGYPRDYYSEKYYSECQAIPECIHSDYNSMDDSDYSIPENESQTHELKKMAGHGTNDRLTSINTPRISMTSQSTEV